MENEDSIQLSVSDYISKFSKGEIKPEVPYQQRRREKLNIKPFAVELSPEIIDQFKALCKENGATQAQMFEALIRYFQS